MPTLYHKDDGREPQQVPNEDRDADGVLYSGLSTWPEGRAATGWIEEPPTPSFDPVTHQRVWNSSERTWEVEPIPASPAIVRVTKADFSRLFTMEQRIKLEALEDAAKAADLSDPGQAATFGPVRVMFRAFTLPAEFIELDHPETIAAVSQLLVGAGVVNASEATRILSGVYPE